MRRFLYWSAALSLIAVLVLVVFVRGMGVSALREAPTVEREIARRAWRFLIPSKIRDTPNPVPESADVLQEAMAHFADHCALCHANNGSGDTTIGRRVFPRVRDLRAKATQQLTDGELFYAVEQGVPWTAMPAWTNGTPDGERDSWALVRFMRYLPKITPAEIAQMEKLNPKSAADAAREKEIDDFLTGGKPPPHKHK